MFIIFFLIQILIAETASNPPPTSYPTLFIKAQAVQGPDDIEVFIKVDNYLERLKCGDGEEFTHDGYKDGVITCVHFRSLKPIERIIIRSPSQESPLFNNIVKMSTTPSPSISFQVSSTGNRWVANRTALANNKKILGIVSDTRGWLISFWIVIVLNIMGWIVWTIKK